MRSRISCVRNSALIRSNVALRASSGGITLFSAAALRARLPPISHSDDSSVRLKSSTDVKNLLALGNVTPEFVERVIVKSDGTEHVSSPHHRFAEIDVHVVASSGWYVKFYFIGNPDTMFVSVRQ